MSGQMKIRYRVMSIGGAFHRRLVYSILNDHGGKWRSSSDRLPDNDVAPCLGKAAAVYGDLHAMHLHRSVVAALHVILARPDEFYGCPGDAPGDLGGFALDVRIGGSAPAEAS